ncbi:MAG: hypothetical protein R3E56_06615 [Burkholderiaceae bacterium]
MTAPLLQRAFASRRPTTAQVLARLLGLAGLLLAAGCDSGAATTGQGSVADLPPDAAKAVRAAQAASGPAPELNLDPLLTPEDVGRLTGFDPGKAKRNRLSKPVNSLHYAWPSDRHRQLPTGLRLPLDNEVQIFQPAVRVLASVETFRQQHLQAPDPAKVERALEALRQSKRYQGMSAASQKTAEQMLLGSANRPPMTDVPSVGQAAAWDAASDTLYVLVNHLVLAVRASVSNDPTANLALASKVAQHSIGKL